MEAPAVAGTITRAIIDHTKSSEAIITVVLNNSIWNTNSTKWCKVMESCVAAEQSKQTRKKRAIALLVVCLRASQVAWSSPNFCCDWLYKGDSYKDYIREIATKKSKKCGKYGLFWGIHWSAYLHEVLHNMKKAENVLNWFFNAPKDVTNMEIFSCTSSLAVLQEEILSQQLFLFSLLGLLGYIQKVWIDL